MRNVYAGIYYRDAYAGAVERRRRADEAEQATARLCADDVRAGRRGDVAERAYGSVGREVSRLAARRKLLKRRGRNFDTHRADLLHACADFDAVLAKQRFQT